MISARLNGGLGNQMFQIATAYVLALNNNDTCAFDFNVFPMGQGNGAASYRNSIYKKLNDIPYMRHISNLYKETDYCYKPIPYSKDMLLIGSFSGEKYIGNRRREILDLFLDRDIVSNLKKGFGAILNNSVSLHVRRGDYLDIPDVYLQLDRSYYNKALRIIKSKTQVDNVLVFSDDIKWCKENLNIPNVYYSECMLDYGDMYLMSLCSHNIMANSSFSWWGSYLNRNPRKIVVAPEKWFVTEGVSLGRPNDAEHLFCTNWIKI